MLSPVDRDWSKEVLFRWRFMLLRSPLRCILNYSAQTRDLPVQCVSEESRNSKCQEPRGEVVGSPWVTLSTEESCPTGSVG